MPFHCLGCGRACQESESPLGCNACGAVMVYRPHWDGGDEFVDVSATGVWRYWRLLPSISAERRISLGEGGTFLQRADRLGMEVGLRRLFLKNETTNPSGSFVDRGVAIEISHAYSRGLGKLSCFSRGNLGVSIAAYAAKVGMETHVYAPPTIERGKLYQLLAYDAQVFFTEKLGRSEVRKLLRGGFYHITSTSPYFLSGLKTLAYELASQIKPEFVVFPVGEGSNITMFWEGLGDLKMIGDIDAMPRLVAVQSEGCMPVVQAYNSGRTQPLWRSAIRTIFSDIAVPKPLLGTYVLKCLRESNGLAVSVSDAEILSATKDLARCEGILAEPAAASTIAALRKMVGDGRLDGDEAVVCVVTGSGLKEPYIERPLGRAARSIAARARAASRIGLTKSHILQLLSEKPSHGYAIRRELARRFGQHISTASTYQHLAELADAGLIAYLPTTHAKRKRTVYSLTPTGRQTIDKQK